MPIRGLTARLCSLARVRAAFLLSILAISSVHLWAQTPDEDDEDESDGSFASLAVHYDARGKADVTFYLSGDVQNWASVQATLEQALHCRAGSLAHPPPDPAPSEFLKSRTAKEQAQYQKFAEQSRMSTLQGACSAAMERKGLLLSTDLQLGPLTAELNLAGAHKLMVSMMYPKSKFSEHTPGEAPSYADSPELPLSRAAELYSHARYVLDVEAPSPQAIHLAFGLRRQDAIRAAVLPALFLLSPILICLWMRRAAIRDAKTDPTGAWFSYFRVLTWCGNGVLLIWMLGSTIRQGLEVLASYYTAGSNGSAVAISVGISLLPPWIAYFLCILLSYGVYVRVRGNTWTRGEFIASQALTVGSQLLPLMCLVAAIGMIAVNSQASIALFIGTYVTYAVCRWLNVKVSGTSLEPLTTGELRDHVFELARKAAVEIRQVLVMPAGKSQMANAFASRNHLVFFTDYLLNRLNKREVSAIAAHEITHIQKKHGTWKIAAFVALLLSTQILSGILNALVSFLRHSLQVRQDTAGVDSAAGLASVVHFFDQVLAFPELVLVLYLFALALYFLQSQYLEHVADAGAVQLTGDPEAVITSLLKLSRLNLFPVQWDRATGSLLTHPSTLKRVQRVARIGQVSPERLEELLTESTTLGSEGPVERCGPEEQFSGATLPKPVVTLIGYSEELTLKKWVLHISYIVPAALVAWTIVHAHMQHKAAAYILGGVASLSLQGLLGAWQETWGRDRLKQKFRTRLQTEGIEANDRDAELIALSPHAVPRYYALGHAWDRGYLFLAKDQLCYAGDQIRFTLRPEQILALRSGSGGPGWFTESRIYIDWQLDATTLVQRWNMVSKEPCSFWRINKQTLDLLARIEHWRSQPAEFPDAPQYWRDISAPAIGEVTSLSLKSAVPFRRFAKVVLFSQVLVFAVCLVFKIPSPLYISGVAFLAMLYSFLPHWLYKSPVAAIETVSLRAAPLPE